MPKLSDLKIDPALEKDGAPVLLPCGIRMTIRRVNYPPFLQARDAYLAALEEEHGEGKVPDEAKEAATCRAIAEHLIAGWDAATMLDDGDAPIAYTPETAVGLMADPQLYELHREVMAASVSREHYRAARVASEGKGSRKRSAGK